MQLATKRSSVSRTAFGSSSTTTTTTIRWVRVIPAPGVQHRARHARHQPPHPLNCLLHCCMSPAQARSLCALAWEVCRRSSSGQ
jgi:hypothetical protein